MSMCTQAYDCIFRQWASNGPQLRLVTKSFEGLASGFKTNVTIRQQKEITNARRDGLSEFCREITKCKEALSFFHAVAEAFDRFYAAEKVMVFAPTVASHPAVSVCLTRRVQRSWPIANLHNPGCLPVFATMSTQTRSVTSWRGWLHH